MMFVDANVFMYAVGRPHPLREEARQFFTDHSASTLVTSAEVLQELLHAYLPVKRYDTLDAGLQLATERTAEIWHVEAADVLLARTLVDRYPALEARDLLHLACCSRRSVGLIKTYDRPLDAAFRRPS